MRHASSRRRFPSWVAVTLVIVTSALASGFVLLGGRASPVDAETVPLSIVVGGSLGLTSQPAKVTVWGQADQNLNGARLVVAVKGPVEPAQVGWDGTGAALAATFVWMLGKVPDGSQASSSPPPAGTLNTGQLAAGTLNVAFDLPAGVPSRPGAYLVAAEVQYGGGVLATGQSWMGKVAPRSSPLDVAFILPLSLGVHRDVEGVFYDRVLETAVAPADADTDGLRDLPSLLDRFPEWSLTLAIEPFLLTQLRDMSDGYRYSATPGEHVELSENDLAAQNASATLTELRALAGRETVEIAAGPYVAADLGLLAAEGWRDGLDQIQMGKQELQQTLGLEAPPLGAYSPDLDLTSQSLAYYANAFIDCVVVDSALQAFAGEQLPPGTVAVRARNTEGDRVTLVFADSVVSAAIGAPWDAGALSAALAASLAAGPRNALVMAPGSLFELPPTEYLESVAEMLVENPWIRTRTLEDLARDHSSGSRPILFQTGLARPAGYIEDSLMGEVRSAHASVSDLAAIADTTRTPIDLAHRLLYVAESRWWSREGTSPQEASRGLGYATRARLVAEGELARVRLLKVDSPLLTGEEGELELTIENAADYPVAVELQLGGEGLAFPDGNNVPLSLEPGRTVMTVRVASAGGPHRVEAALAVGSRILDEFSHSVRFLRLMTVLPWLIVMAVLLAGGGTFLLVRRRLRRAQEQPGE